MRVSTRLAASRGVAALWCSLAAVGCGSTVQTAATGAAAGSDAAGRNGLGVPAAVTAANDASGAGVVPGDSSSGTAIGGSGVGPPGGSGEVTAGSGATASVPAASRPGGSTSTTAGPPIAVGLLYLDGVDKFASTLGIDGLSTGDAVAQAKAIVANLNSRGGLQGRQIRLVTYGMRAGADPTSEHSAACAALTEDGKVRYVVSYVQLQGAYLACYAKRGVAVLDDASSLLDEQGAKFSDIFGAPGDLLAGRAVRNLVDSLWRTGWLTKNSVVGTLVYDTPDGRALEQTHLLPALKRYGIVPKVTARSSTGGDGVSQQNGYVLQYKAAGVDRIIPAGASPLFLMAGAESQNYRPRYAIQSTFGPGFLEGQAPRNQLQGAAGIGWQPALDIGAGRKPGPVSSNETRCLTIMKNSGQQATGTARAFQLHLCNDLFWLQAAANAVGAGPRLVSRARAVLGSSYQPSNTFTSRAVPGRVDGAGSYRDLAYDDSCGCFQYTSGNQPVR